MERCEVERCDENQHENGPWCYYHKKVAKGLLDPDTIEKYPAKLLIEMRENREMPLGMPHKASREYRMISQLMGGLNGSE